MPGAPVPHSEIAAKGHAIAEMLFAIESARALYYRAISEAQVDAPLEAVQRARAAHVTVQRAVVTVTQEAIRVCVCVADGPFSGAIRSSATPGTRGPRH